MKSSGLEKNLLVRMFCIGLVVLLFGGPAAAAPHIVVEAGSGKVLSQEQAFDRWYPASLTKLMTVYTVFQEIGKGKFTFDSPVVVSSRALAQPPSKMGFPVGTVMTVDTAVKILMVKSANDIATAIAESIGGSESAFVGLMNGHARRLGMRDTQFVNPHGLHDPRQYTSARDLAVLALALRSEFPQHAGYFSIPAIQAGKRVLQNHNPLLQRFDGTTGMKTGFVCASGLNIVASVKRGGRTLVAVVLGGPTGKERNVRAARLLTEGFKKSTLFVTQKLDTLAPDIGANRFPRDMRDIVCSRKKKKTASEDEESGDESSLALAFAAKGPTLDDLEKIYLRPKGRNARVVPIVLGNASGPDPFGLVAGKEAQQAAGKEEAVWLTVPGRKRLRVPLPTFRPASR